MSSHVSCPRCGRELSKDDPNLNKFDRCPHCGASIEMTEFPDADPEEGEITASNIDGTKTTDDGDVVTESESQEVAPSRISPIALIGGAGAALTGALIWAGVSASLNIEIGYLAWGIGLLVGGVAAYSKGRGPAMGLACAVLVLLSIFGGKILAFHFALNNEIDSAAEQYLCESNYRAAKQEADAFCRLPSDATEEQLRTFMVDYQYTEGKTTDEVTNRELSEFKTYTAGAMREFSANRPSYQDWYDDRVQAFQEGIHSEFDITSAVVENLDILDIIFGLLGVATAYRLVNPKRG